MRYYILKLRSEHDLVGSEWVEQFRTKNSAFELNRWCFYLIEYCSDEKHITMILKNYHFRNVAVAFPCFDSLKKWEASSRVSNFKVNLSQTLSPFIAYVENILKIIAQYSKSNMFFTHSKRLLFLIIQLTKHEIFLKNNSNFMWGWSYGVYRVKFRLVLSSQQWLSEVKRTTFSFILFPG